MVYFSSIIIALGLYFIDLSLLPHTQVWISAPLFLLAFISIISMKDRTIFPIFLAGIMGYLTDSVIMNTVTIYSIAYLSIAIITKVAMNRFISYGELRANFITALLGIVVIYGFDIYTRIDNLNYLGLTIQIGLNTSLMFILIVFYLRAGRKYFSWIEDETESRFR